MLFASLRARTKSVHLSGSDLLQYLYKVYVCIFASIHPIDPYPDKVTFTCDFNLYSPEGHRRIQMRIDRRETCANAQTVKPSVLRESTRAIRKKRGSSNILRALNVHCSLWQKFTRRDFVQRVMYNYTEFEPRDDPETSNLEFWMIQGRMNTGFEHNFAGKSFHRG